MSRYRSREWYAMLGAQMSHDERCAVRQGGYCGGPCTCGLVDPAIYNPVAYLLEQADRGEAHRSSPPRTEDLNPKEGVRSR